MKTKSSQSSPVETPVRSAEEILKEKLKNIHFIRSDETYALVIEAMEEYASQFKPSVVGESRIKELEATIDNLRNQIEYAAEATRKYVREKEEQRFTIEDMLPFASYCGPRCDDDFYKDQFDIWIKTRKQ